MDSHLSTGEQVPEDDLGSTWNFCEWMGLTDVNSIIVYTLRLAEAGGFEVI
jgi:hypothetical protein